MTRPLVDTSVLIKWFHDAGESELVEARAIRDAAVLAETPATITWRLQSSYADD